MTCDFDCGPVLSQKEDRIGHIMSIYMFPTDGFVLALPILKTQQKEAQSIQNDDIGAVRRR